MSDKLGSRRDDNSSVSCLFPSGHASADCWRCISCSRGGAWVGADSRELGASLRFPQAGTTGLWNIDLTNYEVRPPLTPNLRLLGPLWHSGVNGVSALMQSSSQAWLYGPVRWFSYSMVNRVSLGGKEHNERPFTAHSGWSGAVYPGVICTDAGNFIC